MPGLTRFMDVLRLFQPERHAWTVQDMAAALHSPPSTVYRHVAALVQAGLLEVGIEARYRLGPTFVEFDRLVRLTDPLTRLGTPMLRRLMQEAGVPCVGLLSRLHRTTVMCVADDIAGEPGFRSGYERGRPMPLARGAASLAILSQLPPRRLGTLLRQSDDTAALAESLVLRGQLVDIRRRGIATTQGEVTPGLTGFAAPVISAPLGLFASVSIVLRTETFDRTQERRHVASLVMAANTLSTQLNASAGEAPELTVPRVGGSPT